MILADITLTDILWSMLVFFFFFIWIMILFQVFIDLFRDHEESGAMKAVWVVCLILFTPITVLVYLIVRGKGMAKRSMAQQQAAQADFDSLREDRRLPGQPDRSDRQGQGAPRRRHDRPGRVRQPQGQGPRLTEPV